MRALLAALALLLLVPAPADGQITEPRCDAWRCEPPPCPLWDCRAPDAEIVIEEYRIETVIEGQLATTGVTQVLRNDSELPVEGEFLHPVPAGASVSGLTLWVDGEPVEGEALEAEEARSAYEEIVARVLDPALLEFADDGLVRLQVFPIPAGTTRTVRLEYTQALPSEAGLVRFRHPFGREHGPAAVESLTAHIEIRTKGELKAVYSPTHPVGVDRIDDRSAIVGFEAAGDAPSSDLSVYYSTAEGPLAMSVLSHRDDEDGTFLLLASPGLADAGNVTAKDVVVAIDVSGSMEGSKIDQARRAATHVLDSLNPDDRFDVVAFSTGVMSFGEGLLPASEAAAGARWVQELAAGGSTDIHGALSEAFDRADPERPLYVVFLTDGLPTEGLVDTGEILGSLESRAPDHASVFAFGVGWDVDTVLLDSLASSHHGTTTYVVPGEPIDEAVSALYAKVGSPVLTDVTVEFDGVEITDLHPQPLPDIFSGDQLVLTGRYRDPGTATITLTGSLAGKPYSLTLEGSAFTAAGGPDALPQVWAGKRIGHLLRQVRIEGPDPETIRQIVELAIRYGIVTPYTSFLVTEDAPFGEQATEDIARSAYEAASTTTAPTSGREAVEAADAAGSLADSEVAAEPLPEHSGSVRIAGGRAFLLQDGTWIDTTYDPDLHAVVRIPFASSEYFSLAASAEDVATRLSVAPSVLVVTGETAYLVVEAGADTVALPETTTSTAPTQVTSHDAHPPPTEGTAVPMGSVLAGILGVLGLLGLGAFTARRS